MPTLRGFPSCGAQETRGVCLCSGSFKFASCVVEDPLMPQRLAAFACPVLLRVHVLGLIWFQTGTQLVLLHVVAACCSQLGHTVVLATSTRVHGYCTCTLA
jgi:hypothetical protein